MNQRTRNAILRPGHNCWRKEHARRVACAIDGDAYFRAARQAILRARHSVFILGWDIHSKLQMVRDDDDDGYPRELGALLDFVAKHRDIEVYVLSWDFAMIYLVEREMFPLYSLNWKTHPRVQFCMDDRHPLGASQHQKIVVVDDSVAFCGGMDLSQWRWDTPQHRVVDERRVDPSGKPYPPFHDVQMVVDGDAAAAIGELARERWQNATGDEIDGIGTALHRDPWPDSLQPLMHDVEVAIARTQAEYSGRQAVREVERLFLDSIAAAERFIYIENQYLTAHCIGDALARLLHKDDAPEVVIVMPRETGGWLEQYTMDVLRSRLMKRLRAADRAGRLRLYYPKLSSASDISLMVHSKVMVVDDRLLRVGSSNLSNRSMGLDSECDLSVEAQDGTETQEAIADFRNQILAEHLGVATEAVSRVMKRENSLIHTIESLCGQERSLQLLDTDIDPQVDQLVPESALLDPERPIDAQRFVTYFVPEEHKTGGARRALLGIVTMTVLLGLAAAWRWSPLGDWLDIEEMVAHARELNSQPLSSLLLIVAFTTAATLAVPLTLLVVTTILAFGSLAGFFYSWVGAELSALLTYAVGHHVGRDLVRRYAGERLNGISRHLSKRGLRTIIVLRIIPVAPYTVTNLVAGASNIGLREFAIGTLLGLLPGLIAIALFADGLVRSMRNPDVGSVTWLIAVVCIIALALLWLRRRLRGDQTSEQRSTES